MIKYVRGDILKSKADIIVIPVNKVGVAGDGLAKQWKDLFPEHYQIYRQYCENLKSKDVYLPKSLIIQRQLEKDKQFFLTFFTKIHWKNKSDLAHIEFGLSDLNPETNGFVNNYSWAFPKLGCGLGGLHWENQVKPLMEKYLSKIDNGVEIYL